MKTFIGSWMVLSGLLCGPVFGQAVISAVPRTGTGNEITVAPGASVVIDVFISNVAPSKLQGYQAALPQTASGGSLGSVTHNGVLPVIDTARADYVFLGLGAFAQRTLTPFPQVLGLLLDPGSSPLVTTPKYGGDFTYNVSANALGDFTISFQGIEAGLTDLRDDIGSVIAFTPVSAIIHVICLNDVICDDGLFCNGPERCVSGSCVDGTAPCPLPGLPFCDEVLNACVECFGPSEDTDCDDGNECTDNVCTLGNCSNPPFPLGTACGDPSDTECDDPDSCSGTGICLPRHLPAGEPCGDPTDTDCDGADTCNGLGACATHVQPDGAACTTDSNDCTADICETGVCIHPNKPADSPCGDPLNTDCDNPDTCDGLGLCLDNLEPDGLACTSDGNDCTQDFCDIGVCVHPNEPIDTPCGSPADTQCDDPDTCDGAGLCEPNFESNGFPCGTPADTDCTDPDTCNGTGVCNANHAPNGLSCNDQLFCTTGEFCTSGNCGGGSQTNCGDGIPCTNDLCNETTDTCDHPLQANKCLIAGTCFNGGNPDPGNECEVCDPGQSTSDWTLLPDGTPCTDEGNDCTQDFCDIGVCIHPNEPADTPCGDPLDTDCDNPDTCNGFGFCLDNLEPDGLGCTSDGNDCTEDFCDIGVCIHPNEPADTPCGDPSDSQCDHPDTCDAFGFCKSNPEPDDTPCDDGNVCTWPDTCQGGVCDTPFPAPTVARNGPRSFRVTAEFAAPGVAQALLVTSPQYPCLAKYIGADGLLTDTPVFQTPAMWGTVEAWGREVVPSSIYRVAVECGGDLSPNGSVAMAMWGDANNDNGVGVLDVFCILDGYAADFTDCSFRQDDIHPCVPNGIINIFDVFSVLDGFSGTPYPCAAPCSGGACCGVGDCFVAPNMSTCVVGGGVFEGDGVDCIPDPCGSPAPAGDYSASTITLIADQQRIGSGGRLTVDVFAEGVPDVRGYEISLEVLGWRGSLEPTRVYIDSSRADYVFAAMGGLTAVDPIGQRLMGVLAQGSTSALERVYLGSFELQASRGAAGTFEVNGRSDGVHVLDSMGQPINTTVVGAQVSVGVRSASHLRRDRDR